MSKSVKLLKPLVGEHNFSKLLYTKPLVRTEAYSVYLHIVFYTDKQSDKQLNKNNFLSTSTHTINPVVYLGMLVPKKAYGLAVDRNRIRRVVRATVNEVFFSLFKGFAEQINSQSDSLSLAACSVYCLFKVNKLPKQNSLIKKGVTIPHQAYLNPHSLEFSQCIHTLLAQAANKLIPVYQKHTNKKQTNAINNKSIISTDINYK